MQIGEYLTESQADRIPGDPPRTRRLLPKTPAPWAWMALALLAAARPASGGDALVTSSAHGVTSRAAQRDSLRLIPFDKLDEEARAKVWNVASRPSIFRRLPVQVMDCDPELYRFLVRYPEVVVNMWRLMNITKVQIERVSPDRFDAADGAGTISTIETVYRSPNLLVMYAKGYYQGPLLTQRVDGHCVLVLKSRCAQYGSNRFLVTHRLDVFLQLDHPAAELIAKALHPLVGGTADHNFAESSKFLGLVSQAAERNGAGMTQLAARLTHVTPDVREQFVRIAGAVNLKAAARNAQPARFRITSGPAGEALPAEPKQNAGPSTATPESYYVLQAPRRQGPQLRR